MKLAVLVVGCGLLPGCAGWTRHHHNDVSQCVIGPTVIVDTAPVESKLTDTAKVSPCHVTFTDEPVVVHDCETCQDSMFPAYLRQHQTAEAYSPKNNLGWGANIQVAADASIGERLLADQRNYYSSESLAGLGLMFGAGAIAANTNIDSQLQEHFQASVRGASSDEWFEFLHANKELGNGLYTLPIMGSAWLAGQCLDEQPGFKTIGLWGERSIRGFVVGVPPLLVLQKATGASRPGETLQGSEWRPFEDENGVSGHAFMSALPFIMAAKLTENRWHKTLWYAASTIGPLSRVNDSAHYPSQVGLGWGMAFLAASAVQQTDTGQKGWSLQPFVLSNSPGLNFQYRR